jgi:undecaprenyl-diphosphatase
MEWFEALILGLVQGFTEFLPVSSSGHLELGNALLNIQSGENLTFAIVVHGATVLSTIVVFFRDIKTIFFDSLQFRWNESTKYLFKILFSLIPVAIVGLFFRNQVESFFTGNILLVGCMLLITATLLIITSTMSPGTRNIPWLHALIIGIAQAIAVLPGISRSGATISTGLLLGNKRDEVTRFSFLMVLIPVIGVNLLDLFSGDLKAENAIGVIPLLIGFLAAFVSGLIACKWMITIVRKGKLIYFGIYCLIIGTIAIVTSLF